MTRLVLAAGSADPDPAHAPHYGWPVAVVFGLVVLALIAWSLWLRYGGPRTPDPPKAALSVHPGAHDSVTDSPPVPAQLPGLSRPEPKPSGRLPGWRGLFRTYQPAVPPSEAGPFPTKEAAEARAHQLDEEFADHLNQYEGFFEVIPDGDHFQVVERRGRKTPREVPGSWTGGLGP